MKRMIIICTALLMILSGCTITKHSTYLVDRPAWASEFLNDLHNPTMCVAEQAIMVFDYNYQTNTLCEYYEGSTKEYEKLQAMIGTPNPKTVTLHYVATDIGWLYVLKVHPLRESNEKSQPKL
ncbi:MAG: hypothetical protein ACKKL6_04115 [Candidatus Komeilibacteria bacterium]